MTVSGRVTVGIPTINRSNLALRAIQSALDQTYRNIEVIVSDDASTDDTVQRVRAIHDPRLVLFEQKQRLGLVGNFDFCLRHASGEFFLLLGDDDVLLPTAIERLIEPFLHPPASISSTSVGVVWCPCRIADANDAQFWTTEAGPPSESAASLLAALFAGNRGPRLSSILVRTRDALAVGGYEKKYGDLCDIGNWGRVALIHEVAVCVREPLVQYTQHHGSTTSQSPVQQWQDWAQIVHADLVTSARADRNAEQQLKSAKTNFISGITLTILIQTIGKPGWIRNAVAQSFRTPAAIYTPYMFRRFFKDGWKVLAARRNSKKLRKK
ncbi:MAG TPA: glycosyltransferase family 2 protein [Acidobacteriaceae bacterium]|nr:glycosyltransferase family 2 protein [Terriglobia bacterium]HVC91560.1 glycosyltransferase family 2 protein [Acidobacteriaceae bacterium]